MQPVCLLDSSVIIDAINGRKDRAETLEEMIDAGTLLACCPVNITEVHMGMRTHEAEKTETLLASLEFFPITREIAKYAGSLFREYRRRGVTLALPDLTIAAVAIANNIHLATDNPKDFPMPELRLYPLS